MHQNFAEFWNLPNTLTGIRVVTIPILIILLCFPGPIPSCLAAIFFLLAGMTDLLDGFFARRHSLVSLAGKFMDPLADKLLVSAALIMLIPLKRVEAWIVFVIIGRELAVTGLRGLAAAEGIVLAADNWGKTKTVLQMSALFALILHYPYAEINFHVVGTVLLWLALPITLISGIGYFRDFLKTQLMLDKK
jgi:CDP-diacylglycerol--glycerol-3-phosphate 3-phosphatidyltransferase